MHGVGVIGSNLAGAKKENVCVCVCVAFVCSVGLGEWCLGHRSR